VDLREGLYSACLDEAVSDVLIAVRPCRCVQHGLVSGDHAQEWLKSQQKAAGTASKPSTERAPVAKKSASEPKKPAAAGSNKCSTKTAKRDVAFNDSDAEEALPKSKRSKSTGSRPSSTPQGTAKVGAKAAHASDKSAAPNKTSGKRPRASGSSSSDGDASRSSSNPSGSSDDVRAAKLAAKPAKVKPEFKAAAAKTPTAKSAAADTTPGSRAAGAAKEERASNPQGPTVTAAPKPRDSNCTHSRVQDAKKSASTAPGDHSDSDDDLPLAQKKR
jgi:hypothetical protein